MKFYIYLLAAGLLAITACTTQYQAKNYDDVYYSAKEKPLENRALCRNPAAKPKPLFADAREVV